MTRVNVNELGNGYVVKTEDFEGFYETLSEALAVRDVLMGTLETKTSSGILFSQYYETWINDLKEREYSPNTLRTYRGNISKHVLPVLKDRIMDEIQPEELDKLLDSLPTHAVRFNVLRALSALYNHAQRTEAIAVNPVKKMKNRLKFKAERERQVLSPTQVKDLFFAMNKRYRITILLGAYMGLRWGEMMALRRMDIDLENHEIHITRAVKRGQGGNTIGAPKTTAGVRTLVIPELIRAHIHWYLDQDYCDHHPTALLFPSKTDPTKPMGNTAYHVYFNEARDIAGLPDLTFHELRHTHLTWYGRTGATNADLMARAGHSSVESVMAYQHSSLTRQKELSKSLPDFR